MIAESEQVSEQERPAIPFASSWPRIYLVVLLHLGVWMLLLAAFTRMHEPSF